MLGIVDSWGKEVVRYRYDAWGNLLETSGDMADTLGKLNVLRYRGYCYDDETGLYYLKARYYNPAWGRFISADSYASTGQGQLSSNMFTYCGNNPVYRVDLSGEFFGTIVGAIGGAIGGAISAAINGDDPLKGALIGAGTGALAGLAVDFAVATGGVGGIVIAAVGGAAAGWIDSAANDTWNGREVDWKKAGINAGVGGALNVLSFGMVDASQLKSGGNVVKNFIANGKKQLLDNTTRKVAGKTVSKSIPGVVKNVSENIVASSAGAAVVTIFTGFLKEAFARKSERRTMYVA